MAQDLLQKQAQAGDAQSQTALSAIGALLGPNFSLAELAPCADEVRALDENGGPPKAAGTAFTCGGLSLVVDPTTEPGHFVNVPIGSPASADSVNAKCGGDCVVAEIKLHLQTLQDPNATTDGKQKALMFLVHFVGDEHQPLHCATEIVNGKSDDGGNGKLVRFDGLELKMHALWDHELQKTDAVNDPAAISQALEQTLPADTSAWTQGDFVVTAAVESFGYAASKIYPAYYAAAGGGAAQSKPGRGRKPSAAQNQAAGPVVDLPADYAAQMTDENGQPLVPSRLQKAGVRLAALLKQALGGAAPAAPNPAAERAAGKIRGAAVPPKW